MKIRNTALLPSVRISNMLGDVVVSQTMHHNKYRNKEDNQPHPSASLKPLRGTQVSYFEHSLLDAGTLHDTL